MPFQSRIQRSIEFALERLKQLQRVVTRGAYADLALRTAWNGHAIARSYPHTVLPLLAPAPKSILVFKPDEIGDAVCALPALKELRSRYPEAHLSVLCKKEVAALYERTRLFDEILPVDVTVRLGRFRSFDPAKALQRVKHARWDVAIYLRLYPASFRVFRKVPAQVLIHPKDPRMNSRSVYQPLTTLWTAAREHHSKELRKILTPLLGDAASTEMEFPSLHWTDEDKAALALTFGEKIAPRFVVIHPFAKLETKRYPVDYWKRLLRENATDTPVVLVGDSNDPSLDLGRPVHAMQGKLTLMQSAYLLSRASVFIGNEGGPAHLAGALGTPTLVLMSGHSSPVEWAPLGKSHIFRVDVPCAPCHRRICPYHLECLTQLTPEAISADLHRLLRFNLSP